MQRVRYERVRELLKRELGEIIRQQIPVQQGGVICVNDVGLAHDLQSAKVFVSVIGTPEQQRTGAELLQHNTIPIQNQLGHAVVLRHTPILKFILDDSIERGDRVLQILKDLEGGPAPGTGPAAGEANPAGQHPAPVPAPAAGTGEAPPP